MKHFTAQSTNSQEQTTMNRRHFLRGLGLMAGLTILPKAATTPAPAEPEPDSAHKEWREILAKRAAFEAKYPDRFAVIEAWRDHIYELTMILTDFTDDLFEASISDPDAVDGAALFARSMEMQKAVDNLAADLEQNDFGDVLEYATGTSATVLCIEWYIRQDPTKEWQPEIDYLVEDRPVEAARLQTILDDLLSGGAK